MARNKVGPATSTGRRSRRVPNAQSDSAIQDSVGRDIAALESKGVDALRVDWAKRFRRPAPPIQSPDILRRLFAWRLQAEAFGDLDADTKSALKRARSAIGKGKPVTPSASNALQTGTVLVREWRGVTHRVLVVDDGFEHEGKRYSSLTEVARAISGTHWSGPRFFGIEAKPKRNSLAEFSGKAKP